MGVWLNVGCGTHRAPEPWVNIDVVEREDVHPDQIVVAGEPLPYPDGSVARVFASHVLEHMPWPDVLAYLQDLRRVLEPGGELMVVGPDVLRTIERYKRDQEPAFILHAVLEYHDANPGFEKSDWPNARHWWNCFESRVAEVVEQAGFQQVTPLPVPEQAIMPSGGLGDWPVVGFAPWQFAVSAVA